MLLWCWYLLLTSKNKSKKLEEEEEEEATEEFSNFVDWTFMGAHYFFLLDVEVIIPSSRV